MQDLYNNLTKSLANPVGRKRGPSGLTMVDAPSGGRGGGGGWWSNIMGGAAKHPHPHGGGSPHGIQPLVPGLYMYGGVGCGKTMLMDLFVSTTPPEFKVRAVCQTRV